MRRLTDSEFEFILDDLEKRGLTEVDIRLELADHIACMIEQNESTTAKFESIYTTVLGSISDVAFPNLQHQILLAMNLKFQAMKKSAYVLGIVSTILVVAGSFFKMMHLPGASILLLVGAVLVVLGFLPLFFYTSYKENEGKTSIILPLGAFMAIALLVAGALFKVLHWPYAREILVVGSIILLVGFLPAYLVSVFRKSKETKSWSAYLLLVILSGTIVFMLSATRISRDVIEKYENQSAEAKQTMVYFSQQADAQYKLLSQNYTTGDISARAAEIKIKSAELHAFIGDIKKQLLDISGNTSEENLKNSDSERPCYMVLQKKMVNIQLIDKVNEFKAILIKNGYTEQSKKLVSVYLGNTDRLENLPLVMVLAKINELERNITLAEYETLVGLGSR